METDVKKLNQQIIALRKEVIRLSAALLNFQIRDVEAIEREMQASDVASATDENARKELTAKDQNL